MKASRASRFAGKFFGKDAPPSQPVNDSVREEFTAKQARARVAELTAQLKGVQRHWKDLTYDVAAGVAGAREKIEEIESQRDALDRELARAYASVEEAERRETEREVAARIAAVEQLASLLVELDAQLASLVTERVPLHEIIAAAKVVYGVGSRAYDLTHDRRFFRTWNLRGLVPPEQYDRAAVLARSVQASMPERAVKLLTALQAEQDARDASERAQLEAAARRGDPTLR